MSCSLLLLKLLYGASPVELVFYASPLNSRECVVEMLCGLSYLAFVYRVGLAVVGKSTDRRNDSRSTAAPALFKHSFVSL